MRSRYEAKPLDVALAHLRRFPTDHLFPLAKLSKRPPLLKANLSENCSNDPDQLREWDSDRRMSGCNWGIALRRSRLIIADIDRSKGKLGLATWRELKDRFGWPATSHVRSPTGGSHLYFCGQHVMKVNGFGAAIDSPNYVVLPGMATNDGYYRYVNDLPRADAPAWFYELLAPSERVANASDCVIDLDQTLNIASAIDYLKHDADRSIEGNGGEFRTMLTAMSLRDLGISEETALDLMLDHYNEQKCDPPWGFEEFKQKIANGYAYASRQPIGGGTAEADFANVSLPSITPHGHDRRENFTVVNGLRISVSRTARAKKGSKGRNS